MRDVKIYVYTRKNRPELPGLLYFALFCLTSTSRQTCRAAISATAVQHLPSKGTTRQPHWTVVKYDSIFTYNGLPEHVKHYI